MAVQTSYVPLIMGSHTWSPDEDKVDKIVDLMRKHGVRGIDTARVYNSGGSETAIGIRKLSSEFTIDTKADTALFVGTGRNIYSDAMASFEALQVEKVRIYFLHGPDETVPFEEQMEAVQKLYLEGRFDKFGISNFSTEQVLEVMQIAKDKGYIAPSVYQSNYSAAARVNEEVLFPTLRKFGFSIQAYSPMAAGFLAKTPEDVAAGKGFFNPDTPMGQVIRPMYNKPSYIKMLEAFGKLSQESGVSRMGLAYRWVRHHSYLQAERGDEMIIGGTTAEQTASSLEELEKGQLEPWVAQRIGELWEIVKDDAPRDNLEFARNVFRKEGKVEHKTPTE